MTLLCGLVSSLVSASNVSRLDHVLSVLISRPVGAHSHSSNHSSFRRHVAISDQLHTPTALLPIKGPLPMERASEPV